MSEKLYNIKLTKSQMESIDMSDDIVSRLFCGQVNEVARCSPSGKVWLEHETESALKKELFPDLDSSAYYGIYSQKAPDTARVLYDIHQVIRNRLAYDGLKPGEKRSFTVNFDSPMRTSEKEKLIEVKGK